MSSSVKSARVNGNGVPALKVESAPPSSGLSVDGSIMSPGGSVASTPPTYNKKLLIEIVSCRDLLPTHKSGFSNPYAKIRFGNSDKHKTSYIEKTLNPCFLPKHKNTYILKASPRDVYAKKGIELVVQDHDTFAFSDNDIGVAKVSAEELYLADGEDMELKLDPPKDSKLFLNGQKAGYITIRVREATQGDKDVIKARSGLFKKARRKSKTVCFRMTPRFSTGCVYVFWNGTNTFFCRLHLTQNYNRKSNGVWMDWTLSTWMKRFCW